MGQIICKVDCPYKHKYGFCQKAVVGIDQLGMCDVWWKKGQRIEPRISQDAAIPIVVEEVEVK